MAGTDHAAYDTGHVEVIEWHMMDKLKFYPLSLGCSLCVRGFLYPLTVVKTRIQVQRQNTVYNGTWDAFKKIYASEGVPGLYKGYLISTFQVLSGVLYVTTYENVRYWLAEHTTLQDSRLRALLGGACASLLCQTFLVPFDVVSQHLMVLGNLRRKHAVVGCSSLYDPLGIAEKIKARTTSATGAKSGALFRSPYYLYSPVVINEILKRDGLVGFYRGYWVSVLCYVPNSALFWSFYTFYAEKYRKYSPEWVSFLFLQTIAALSSGITTTCLTNPLDLVRARMQVQRSQIFTTIDTLWREERWGIFKKGLSARLASSSLFSTLIIFGYESLKRFSVHPHYQDQIRW